jgi:lipoprotein-releasing system ATP-binding protein
MIDTPGGIRGPLAILSATFRRAYSDPDTPCAATRRAIMGPSGAGKSTLLYILGGLEQPTSGTVTLDGRNPFSAIREGSGRLPQSVDRLHLSGSLPAAAVFGARECPGADAGFERRRGAVDRARDLLAQVGLSDRLDHRPAELSGGEKQRVALARALIRKPLLLLCDEPTGNLDQASADVVASLLLELHRGRRPS